MASIRSLHPTRNTRRQRAHHTIDEIVKTQAERRQVTLMFCDLVDSTRLAQRYDPEVQGDILQAFHGHAREVIESFGGHLSQILGDGFVAVFGFPRADEYDASNAVQAALELVKSMARLALPVEAKSERLIVRIGIATGLGVVGDPVKRGPDNHPLIAGEVPILAERLQGLAPHNAVLISPRTREIVGRRFECVSLGTHPLKGFPEPVEAWQVVALRNVRPRPPRSLQPMVDREEHLSWLLELWDNTCRAGGRAAVLLGEAGIGKSRLVAAAHERIPRTAHQYLHFQCAPLYANTALYPVAANIRRAAGIEGEDQPAVKLAKLGAWHGGAAGAAEAIALLASLLSIPLDDRYPPLALSPQRQKERLFEVFLDRLKAMAAAQPLLVVVDDLHWVDPTTLEFIGLLIDALPGVKALLVCTARPDHVPAWRHRTEVECRELTRLQRRHALELVRNIAGDRFNEDVLARVAEVTDGVPLFIEESTNKLLSDVPSSASQRLIQVPETIQDLLMARLDQVGSARLVAQVASAIGKEFSLPLLERVYPGSPSELRIGLDTLEQARLILPEAGGEDVEVFSEPESETVPAAQSRAYTFKHVLVQEVAYQSLLRRTRNELHERIATALEAHFPLTAQDAPELLAHHWTEAGNTEKAVRAWLAAGRRASGRSEYREAIAHLRNGLALINSLADDANRHEVELALVLALAPAIITTEGAGTPEVGALYARALQLCEATPRSTLHFVTHWGWWRTTMNHRMGRTRADTLLDLAHDLRAPELLLQAHHCQWATLYMIGEHAQCCRHVDAGLALYDEQRDAALATLYGGHDARVCAFGEAGLARWMLGDFDRSMHAAQAALDWSEQLSHVGSRVHAMDYALVLRKFRRDLAAVQRQAEALASFATEQKLRVFRAKGVFFRGWARAMQGEVKSGLAEMLEGIASERAADTPHDFTLYFEMLAEAHQAAGQIDAGLRAVEEAFAVAEQRGIVYWNAELHRRKGELLRHKGDDRAARAALADALACAAEQGATALHLRAALSLAQLQIENGDRAAARALLAPIHARFVDGSGTADLVHARALLDSLS